MKIPKSGYDEAPRHADGFQRYFEEGILPGGFLQALLANNLYLASQRADPTNLHLFREYTWWLDEYAPKEAYGSTEKMQAWCLLFPGGVAMLKRLEV